MKRMLSLVLALALLFILTACTAGSSSTAGNTASEEDISYIGGSKGISNLRLWTCRGTPASVIWLLPATVSSWAKRPRAETGYTGSIWIPRPSMSWMRRRGCP